MFFFYNLLLGLAAPVALPYHLLRRRWQGKGRGTLVRHRVWPSLQQTGGGVIWLHAVSVGEVLSCRELVARLKTRLPASRLLVSTATETGQALAREKLAGLADGFFYAPLDFPFAVRRVLRCLEPRLVVVAETEIWPNLFRETKRAGAGLLMVNARISDRSAARYRRLSFFFRRVLSLPDAILAQSELDRQRLLDAGAPPERVEVGGNLKFDSTGVEASPAPEIVALRESIRPDKVILAGSTREGEEEQVLAAWSHLTSKHPKSLLILAPRHLERFDAVAELLARGGYRFARRSRLPVEKLDLPGVLLVDSLGELAALYSQADVVFVGGSLVEWGGHNVLEPAFAGRPIVVGPNMQNFRVIAEALSAAGGLLQVGNAHELEAALVQLLEDPQRAAAIGARARRWAESQQGASERAANCAGRLYGDAVPNPPRRLLQRVLLWAPARIWETAVRQRERAFEQGRRPRRRLETCTVSVGSLTAGGAGKTPVAMWLIEQLQTRGLACAVLSRGYRRASSEAMTVLEPGATPPPSLTGDEIQLYLRRVRIPVGIAADRYRAGVEIEARFRPDVLVLDDGFQHQQLARDLDIVAVDVTAPFGGGEFLPLGRLREPPSALERAGVILLTRAVAGERWDGLQAALRHWNPRAPILMAYFDPIALVDATTGQEQPLSRLAGRPVAAFCGVGNPRSFWRILEKAGLAVAEWACFPDHHRYSHADADRLLRAARRVSAVALVTTEKDLVNWWRAAGNAPVATLFAPLTLYWLKTGVTVEHGEEILDLVEGKVKGRTAALFHVP